jgi:DHA1 family multidrug resistance protein-like MFS transporter
MSPQSQPSLRRNLFLLAGTVFSVYTGFAFVMPFLPLYVRELGVSDPQATVLWAGVLLGVAPLLAGLMAPVWGRLAERHGHKRMAVRALGGYTLLLLLSALVTAPWQLLILRAGTGLVGGIGPLSLAMASSQAPEGHTGKALGILQAAQLVAAAAGPLTGGLLADWIGIRATFVVTAGLCGASCLVLWRFYTEGPEPPGSSRPPSDSFASVLRIPGLAGLLLVLFMTNFVSRSFVPVLPLHLELLGVGGERLARSTGLLISVYSLAAAASATGLGALSRRRSPRGLLALSLVGGAVAVAPMALAPSFAVLLALAVVFGLVSGGSLTLGYTLGGEIVPEARRSTAYGFLSGAALFGGAISPTVAGLLTHWDLLGIYAVDAALLLALALLVVLSGPSRRAGAAANPE